MKEIWIATTNQHKVQEFQAMFQERNIVVKSMLDLEEKFEIEETGTTFEENAIIKAEALSALLQLPVIADDSGFVVDALDGEPGIHSARYLGHDTSYSYKNNVILERMRGITDRSCRFICVIALAKPNQKTRVFTGIIEGEVAHNIAGSQGFGYDPIFYVSELNKNLSQLSEIEKNAISHRGQACELLMEYIIHEK